MNTKKIGLNNKDNWDRNAPITLKKAGEKSIRFIEKLEIIMEINHKTFGKIKFNYDWTKDISLDIFNKRHVLEINIDADEDAEFEINQEKAYIFFNNHLDEIVKEANSAIISYYNHEISDIVSSYTNHNEKNII